MGVRITSQEGVVALYDSTTDWAFGPVFEDEEAAEDFEKFAREATGGCDLRQLEKAELGALHRDWCRTREEVTP